MPRFVLLRHQCPPSYGKPSHWDFMLEWGKSLRTWELRELPRSWATSLNIHSSAATSSTATSPTESVEAIPLADHRLAYLGYQGPLTDDRGSVQQCDAGTYDLCENVGTRIRIRLSGTLLTCDVQLDQAGEPWTLTAFQS